ncbi:hypothetical protein SBOR_3491 [Sclerotinia borealis F-4128]|uniref:Phytocyanin domain-containing protein n=1 Tax=Sclerotinia borealis (strain F-4128) TaxID=1432307 RepID=W9CH76_SCLBF|nr:hypothetical protein SBOR_3491 [Sclerotinia borealis F-4128]
MHFTPTLLLSALSISSVLGKSSLPHSIHPSPKSHSKPKTNPSLPLPPAAANTTKAPTTSTTTHVVRVGSSTNNSVKYFPDNITAAVGDVIQFQFAAGNHTVTQSTFDAPCVPISQSSNTTGVYSGFMDVGAGGKATGMVPVFSMMVKAKTPMWFYCSQAKHCQKGMVLVVNEK